MQLIAGVHFNYSLPETFWPAYRSVLGGDDSAREFRSEHYLRMIRNFRRMGWIVLYLFGSSPAVCKSFAGPAAKLPSLNADTWYEPWATSLRMSDLGYSNKNQSRINISLNSVDEYIRDLSNAICTPESSYEEIGVKVDGRYRQLNANLLQIENEYYSPVRPKRIARSGEQPTAALRRAGIEYVEVRSLDINMFDPSGVNQNTMRFLEAFLIYCLLEDSPPLGEEETREAGRLRVWASEIVTKVSAIAEMIDNQDGDDSYAAAVRLQQKVIDDPEATLSARIVAELEKTGSSFFEFALGMARCHSDYSIAPLRESQATLLANEAAESVQRQKDIEAADEISLDEYLQRYFMAC
jgi:glutamate--cysteine ligase